MFKVLPEQQVLPALPVQWDQQAQQVHRAFKVLPALQAQRVLPEPQAQQAHRAQRVL